MSHRMDRTFEHPYANVKAAAATHGHLQETPRSGCPVHHLRRSVRMDAPLGAERNRRSGRRTAPSRRRPALRLALGLRARSPRGATRPFLPESASRFLARLLLHQGRPPLGDHINRLVVGVGDIIALPTQPTFYESRLADTYPMWDQAVLPFDSPRGRRRLPPSVPRLPRVRQGTMKKTLRRAELLQRDRRSARPFAISKRSHTFPSSLRRTSRSPRSFNVSNPSEDPPSRNRTRAVGTARGLAERADLTGVARPWSIPRSRGCSRSSRPPTRNCTRPRPELAGRLEAGR